MSSKFDESKCSPSAGVGAQAAPPVGGAGPTVAPPPPFPFHEPVDEEDDKPNPASAAFGRIKGDIDELKEYASYYLAAKVDGLKRTARTIGLYAALGVIGLVAGGAIIATAAGLIIVGIAEGLGRLFGDRYWLGDLVTGLLVLSVIGGAAWFMMKKLTGSWRSQTIKKYEQRKQTQRVRFGHNVKDRATEGAAATRTAGAQKRA